MDNSTTPISWIGMFTPLVAFVGAIWVSGYKIGKAEAALRQELQSLKKEHSDLKGTVGSVTLAVNELAEVDCIEEEEFRSAGYLTRVDLVKEQEICRRDREHKSELFAQQMINISSSIADHANSVKDIALEMKSMNASVSTEIRHMREALIKKGIIE